MAKRSILFILLLAALAGIFSLPKAIVADGGPIPTCSPNNPKGTQTKCQADEGHRGN